MQAQVDRKTARRRVRRRIRRRIAGTASRPRLAVFRSLKHIYVQAIDDEAGRTLVHVSTLGPDVRGAAPAGGNVPAAKAVGREVARKLTELGVRSVVFDRGGFGYHGRIKALADAAREGGLEF
jgi:large subunit ribosomal protein L18